MVTSPEIYLLDRYRDDLAVFGESGICGLTMHEFTVRGCQITMFDWRAFMLVQYEMNLLRQAFHAYGIAKEPSPNDGWPEFRANSCHFHGGFTHPVDILSGSERLMNRSRDQDAPAFDPTAIASYDSHFAFLARRNMHERSYGQLLEGIRTDPDCSVHSSIRYLRRMGIAWIWQVVR
jgi:hypothetical protein